MKPGDGIFSIVEKVETGKSDSDEKIEKYFKGGKVREALEKIDK